MRLLLFIFLSSIVQFAWTQIHAVTLTEGLARYGEENTIIDMEFIHDDHHLLVAYSDSLRLFNLKKQVCERTVPYARAYKGIGFYPHSSHKGYAVDGNTIYTVQFERRETEKDPQKSSFKTQTLYYNLVQIDLRSGETLWSSELLPLKYMLIEKDIATATAYTLSIQGKSLLLKWYDQVLVFQNNTLIGTHTFDKSNYADVVLLNETQYALSMTDSLFICKVDKPGEITTAIATDTTSSVHWLSERFFGLNYEGKLHLWDGKGLQKLRTLSVPNSVTKIHLYNDSILLFQQHNFGWRADAESHYLTDLNGKDHGELLIEKAWPMLPCIQPVSNRICFLSETDKLLAFDIHEGKDKPILVPQVPHVKNNVEEIDFSHDQRYMLTRCNDYLIVWDVPLQRMIKRYEMYNSGDAYFKPNSHDIIYEDGASWMELKWKNYLSNFEDNLNMRVSSSARTVLPRKESRNRNRSIVGYDFTVSEDTCIHNATYDVCILRNKETYKDEVIISKGREHTVLELPEKDPYPDVLCFFDEHQLAVGCSDHVFIFDLRSQKVQREFRTGIDLDAGMLGVQKVYGEDKKLVAFMNDQTIKRFNLENGTLEKRYDFDSGQIGASNYFDINETYNTFQYKTNTNFMFQSVHRNDGKRSVNYLFWDRDTSVFINTLEIKSFNFPNSFIGAIDLQEQQDGLFLIRTQFEPAPAGRYTSDKPNTNYLYRLDINTNALDQIALLPKEFEIPNIISSNDGKFVAVWDYNESSEDYRKKYSAGFYGEDQDSFDEILVFEVESNKSSKLSLTKLGINRVDAQCVQFHPKDNNLLIVRDDFVSVIHVIDVRKKQTVKRITGVPQYAQYGDDSRGQALLPFTSSPTGDTLLFAIGNPIDHYVHKTIRAEVKGEGNVPDDIFTDRVKSAGYSSEGDLIFLGHDFDAVSVADRSHGIIGKFISSDADDLFVTPDGYYRTTGNSPRSFFFRVNDELYPLAQFDLKFNRPDIVLQRLGKASKEQIDSYRKAYLKRLEKLHFTEDMLSDDFHLPEVELLNRQTLSSSDHKGAVSLHLKCIDNKAHLDRILVYINNVPVFGQNGIDIRALQLHQLDTVLSVPLSEGINRIECSVLNSGGAESFRQSIELIGHPEHTKRDLYFVGLGVSNYKDTSMNLAYADKDIRDMANVFAKANGFDSVHLLTYYNADVTSDVLTEIKEELLRSSIEDHVILMFSGHGVLDQELNYYLSSHDIDFMAPQRKGIPYDAFEELLDSIPARKKLMLLDACHSGEIDKTTVKRDTAYTPGMKEKRTGKSSLMSSLYSTVNTFEVMKELFADLRRGTGATVISSSAGNYFSFEDPEFQNGAYTYALKLGLSGEADTDKSGEITVSELKVYLYKKVEELTNGQQRPTSRKENLGFDFRVY